MSELEEHDFELTEEQLGDLKESFDEFDVDHNGHITVKELGAVFSAAGAEVPGYKVREVISEYDKDQNGTIEFDEFVAMFKKVTDKYRGAIFKSLLSTNMGVKHSGGTSESSAEGTKHSHSKEEQVAFADWINSSLKEDESVHKYLPIDASEDSSDLYEKVKDGILLCKMINLSAPGTIDERVINKPPLKVFTIHENQTLVINSALAIGCNLVNIGAGDLAEGKKHLVLGVLWQVIRIGLFSKITLTNVPGLARLLQEGETIEGLHHLSPEELLLRWVNFHLGKYYDGQNYPPDDSRRKVVHNFSDDIKDSEAYSILLYQIAPQSSGVDHPQSYYSTTDNSKKAEKMLRNAEKIGCRKFVRAKDVVSGNQKLNMAFVANLFSTFPNLPELDDDEGKEVGLDEEYQEETREELTYRNWINSMGCGRYVNWLYSDFFDGIILFKMFEHIRPGCVDWEKKVNPEGKCKNARMGGKVKCIENCNYAVDLGKQFNFSLIGIQGQDIHEGVQNLTLGLIWQMMRAYTYTLLARLSPDDDHMTEEKIVEWVNKTLQSKKKTHLINKGHGFKDPDISTSLAVLDLIDCISPKMINPALINPDPLSDEDKLPNAQYAISMARKIGAVVYALPEDLVEVKPKMVLTVFASLMLCALEKSSKNKKGKK
ncbi:predicted protein [Nematostella vectensis]|uniref:Uncharacterized protein n=2 Tax=Nematostella vectensis TaxID=45351 RepID=A7S7E1_NEMVE|nr:predicted protein [Nematostella vectensis]|eukprot:XP_001632445.1 predicted protein [Nematostella vectensis]